MRRPPLDVSMPTSWAKDFDYTIFGVTAHRPWPMPDSPWIMTQTWRHLLFAHWPVSADMLRERMPVRFDLDRFDGQAWLGVVPFEMSNVAPRGVPALPGISRFPELNVRTYVSVKGVPGVYFFSLDAGNALVATMARLLFHLPYFAADMELDAGGDSVSYRSRRRAAMASTGTFVARYRATGPEHEAAPGSLEYFLTERYCLFTTARSGSALRVDIHHPPWRLRIAAAEFEVNTMAAASGLQLPDVEPLLHVASRQDVVAWAPRVQP